MQQAGGWNREGGALNNPGIALREAGRLDEAVTAYQDAAAIFREARDRNGEAMSLAFQPDPGRPAP